MHFIFSTLYVLTNICIYVGRTQLKSNQEAIATHGSWWYKLTASLLSASSLCHTRLVRSLGNLHVVAGDRDPMRCEPGGSHRDTANTGTLINLNMAQVHLQASSRRPTLSLSETWATFAHKHIYLTRPLFCTITNSHIWD